MENQKNANKVVTATLKIIEALAHQPLVGLQNKELVAACEGLTPSKVTRHLQHLEASGWATKLSNGNWRLTSHFFGMALHGLNALEEASGIIGRLRHQFTENANKYSQ